MELKESGYVFDQPPIGNQVPECTQIKRRHHSRYRSFLIRDNLRTPIGILWQLKEIRVHVYLIVHFENY